MNTNDHIMLDQSIKQISSLSKQLDLLLDAAVVYGQTKQQTSEDIMYLQTELSKEIENLKDMWIQPRLF